MTCQRLALPVILVILVSAFLAFTQTTAAQTGQTNSAAGSGGNATNLPDNANANMNARAQPAPWRPNFGTLARQNPSNPSLTSMPVRQPQQNTSGVASTSSQPAGINLQTGTGNVLPANIPANTNPSAAIFPQANPVTNNALPATAPGNRLPPPNSAPATTTSIPNPAANPIASQTVIAGNQSVDQRFEAVPIETRRSITRVTKSMNQLPNDAGQVWREYDITPYTNSIQGIDDPQQAILDWVLKETGTEMWFNQPLGILNADRNQLRVYHTPEIQKIVHAIVDRFVNTRAQVQNLEVSLVTVGNPNWRSSAYSVLQPIEVQSPGVEAWMVAKENAALLRASLARRGDFKDHGTGRIAHNDGQTVVLKKTAPVQFIRNFRWVTGQIPSYQPLVTTVDEGYTLEISSLSSLDGQTVEASIQCHVDQVEKLNTVKVDVPGSVGATTDRITLQIPQLVSWRLKERFRWRDDQVLLLSCGVVASPGPENSPTLNLPRVFGGPNRPRADALLFVDYRGPQIPGKVPQNSASRTVPVERR